ncbi:MAG: hypothetical protein ACKVT2_11845 [Saprospiraceae bacterium]
MKNITTLLVLLILARAGFAQEKETCNDVVYLTNGSVFRGKIIEYQHDGELIMASWSGGQMRLPSQNVKKIEQKCRGDKRVPMSQRAYTFRESGWYHATRAAAIWGQNGVGFGLQHSSGWKFNRLLSIGIGAGIENLTPKTDDVSTYPVFAEARGYLSPKYISPFYAIGFGWGFAGKENDFDGGFEEDWSGGLMTQWQIGYRLGNNLTFHGGIRFQRKTRNWQDWWGGGQRVDKILQKRFEFGLGILI